MTRDEAESISFRDFTIKKGAFIYAECRQLEIARTQIFFDVNKTVEKGKPGLKLEQIMKLPTDEISTKSIADKFAAFGNFIKNG